MKITTWDLVRVKTENCKQGSSVDLLLSLPRGEIFQLHPNWYYNTMLQGLDFLDWIFACQGTLSERPKHYIATHTSQWFKWDKIRFQSPPLNSTRICYTESIPSFRATWVIIASSDRIYLIQQFKVRFNRKTNPAPF